MAELYARKMVASNQQASYLFLVPYFIWLVTLLAEQNVSIMELLSFLSGVIVGFRLTSNPYKNYCEKLSTALSRLLQLSSSWILLKSEEVIWCSILYTSMIYSIVCKKQGMLFNERHPNLGWSGCCCIGKFYSRLVSFFSYPQVALQSETTTWSTKSAFFLCFCFFGRNKTAFLVSHHQKPKSEKKKL